MKVRLVIASPKSGRKGLLADSIKKLDAMNWDYRSTAVRIKPK